MTITEKYEAREIFVRHGRGLRKYPFMIVTCKDNDTDAVLWEGMVPAGDAIYNTTPQKDELDTPQLMEPMIDPPFLWSKEMATGINYHF